MKRPPVLRSCIEISGASGNRREASGVEELYSSQDTAVPTIILSGRRCCFYALPTTVSKFTAWMQPVCRKVKEQADFLQCGGNGEEQESVSPEKHNDVERAAANLDRRPGGRSDCLDARRLVRPGVRIDRRKQPPCSLLRSGSQSRRGRRITLHLRRRQSGCQSSRAFLTKMTGSPILLEIRQSLLRVLSPEPVVVSSRYL
jgi:hypothetical protein